MPAIRHPYHQLAAAGHAARQTVADLARAVAAAVAAWLRNHRERRLLAGLDDNLLRDLGLTRADVARGYDRPFWQSVDYGRLEAARRRSGPRLGTCR